jgi:hypothetical protein
MEGSTTNAAGNRCLASCAAGGETSDADGNNQCDVSCIDVGQFLNKEGDDCLVSCSSQSQLIDVGGVQCVTECKGNQLINLDGNQCVTHCDATENQLIGIDGLQCVAACSLGEFVGLTGDRCLVMCPYGSDPNSTNPPQCQCQLGLVPNFVGDQCVSPGKDKKSKTKSFFQQNIAFLLHFSIKYLREDLLKKCFLNFT